MTEQSEFEEVACDLCGSTKHDKVLESPDYRLGCPGLFSIVKCNDCGLYFINPRPTELVIGQYYPDDYHAFDKVEAPSGSDIRRRLRRLIRCNRVVNAVIRLVPSLRYATHDPWMERDIDTWYAPGKFLDVGCGSGGYLDLMADIGWETYGIEINQTAAELAKTKGHYVACQSATKRLPETLTNNCFDLIHMSHSLEHVHSPSLVLKALHKILRPKTGYIVVEVPNISSVFSRLFHEFSPAFDPPRHLFMFSPQTLSLLLKNSGFTTLGLRHISRPVQLTRSLKLVMDTVGTDWNAEYDKELLEDPEFLSTLTALSNYANEKGRGGAIRIVAQRAPGAESVT